MSREFGWLEDYGKKVGFKVSTVQKFLGLSHAEMMILDMRMHRGRARITLPEASAGSTIPNIQWDASRLRSEGPISSSLSVTETPPHSTAARGIP